MQNVWETYEATARAKECGGARSAALGNKLKRSVAREHRLSGREKAQLQHAFGNTPDQNYGTVVSEICWQRHVYQWALDHRVHHKYSETNADPHDARRGFMFSHIGWLVLTPHPEVEEKRKVVDMSDLEADPIVMWQKR
jgi:hypothetical protein